jgi:predicted nucleic acid-binding protein
MMYPSECIAVLDACVLYPAPLRDLLLSLAGEGLYRPKWSAEIQEEWLRNLLVNRPDLTEAQLSATVQAMNRAFPDATVENHRSLIQGISLPDPDDRHVVAAAIRAKADVIVTYNLKDFPDSVTKEFDVKVQHPDIFISNVFDLNPDKALDAFRKQVKRLRNPPRTFAEVLDTLRKAELKLVTERLTDIC